MKLRMLSLIVIGCFLFSSCATCPISKDVLKRDREIAQRSVMAFDLGVRYLAKEVFCQLVKCSMSSKRKTIIINPFINHDTGQELRDQEKIETLVTDVLKEQFDIIKADSKIQPTYKLEGSVVFDEKPLSDDERKGRLNVFVIETKNGKKKAEASVKLSWFDCPLPSEQAGEKAINEKEVVEKKVLPKLDPAIRLIVNELRCQMIGNSFKGEKKVIMINRLINYNTGYELKLHGTFENVMIEELGDEFVLARTKSNTQSDYTLEGMVFFEDKLNTEKKIPHLYVTVINMKEGIIVASANVFLSEIDISTNEIDERDLFFQTGKRRDEQEKIIKTPPGEKILDNYNDMVEIDELIRTGEGFHDDEQYEKAIEFYKQAENITSNEEDLEIVYQRLGDIYCNIIKNQEQCKQYTNKRTTSRLDHRPDADSKLFFKPGTAYFIEDKEEEYLSVIESIKKYSKEKNKCVEIYGHCSRTGSLCYNWELSNKRAKKVAELLNIGNERITYIGRSFVDCKVCDPVDDKSTEFDRRVEFKIIECGGEKKKNSCESLKPYAREK